MGEGSTVYESLVKKFEYIRMEHLFFKAAFKNDEQNNLKEHDFKLIRQFYIDQIEGKSHRKISDKLLFQLEMFVDVVSAEEGVYHVLIFAEVCHDAQLYLRVVGREELAAVVGDERLADFLSVFVADGDQSQYDA